MPAVKSKVKIDKVKLERVAFILKTIAHPTRLAIVQLLDHKERLSVNELIEHTGCEQSLLSHHLSNMKIKGLLSAEREGQNIYYSLREKDLVNIVDCIEHCKCNM
ncbi:MAG: metalloregulator ArsR/SmtB family transcription factor [Chitinophagales bacterium]